MDVAAGKAPGIVGSVPVRAFDIAHEIAMQDHQMTDIRAEARPGESSVPRLPAPLQEKVDNFWGGPQKKSRSAKVDLSPLYGQRATQAQQQDGSNVMRFKADNGVGVEPILRSKPAGSSPIPEHTVIAAG